MCLVTNYELTAEMKKESKTLTCWKVVEKYDDHMCSIFYNHSWHVGVNRANYGIYDVIPPVVGRGIHVFLNKYEAYGQCRCGTSRVVIAVECNTDDLIAAGQHDCSNEQHAAFYKVTLTQEEYDRVMNNE